MGTQNADLKLITLLPGQIRNDRDRDDTGLPLPAKTDDEEDNHNVKSLLSLKDLERIDQGRASGYTVRERGEGDSFTAFNSEAPLSNSRGLVSFPGMVQGIGAPVAGAVEITSPGATFNSAKLSGRVTKYLASTKVANKMAFLGKVPYLGKTITLGGGRIAPGIGAAIAGIDCSIDLYKVFTLEKEDAETEEAFKKRSKEIKSNAAINIGCTAAGALIGACLGGPLGALIGAGIGNIAGNLLKGGGAGKIGRAIVGFFTGR